MTDPYHPPMRFNAETILRCPLPRVVPLDEAMQRHLSQTYWDWQSLFDRDSNANPLQHPDVVLAELEGTRVASKLASALVRIDANGGCPALGILVPKHVRTDQVGGVGPGWTLHGLRLAGGRFLAENESYEVQSTLLLGAVRHCAAVGAAFLLIEDLDERSPLYGAVLNEAAHGCRLFATRDVQPRLRIEFPATADEYWKTFSSRSLSKFRRSLKKFGDVRLERVTGLEQLPDFLRAAHDISKQSWQSRQFGLRIRNDDDELRLLSALAQQGLLRSYLWWIEGQPAAFALCHQHRGCFHYEEIAFCGQHTQFSPGRVMLQQIVEDLFQHDPPQWFDFGGGDAEYKRQFANRESRSGTLWLVPPTWGASLSLAYLKSCRQLRAVARRAIQTAGLATKARQWIRRVSPPPAASESDATES